MKPRKNMALLDRQDPRKQERLWRWLNGDKNKGVLPLTYAEAIVKVKKCWGIKVSDGQLSKFYGRYKLQSRFQELEQRRSNYEQILIEKFPQLDPKAIQEHGQAFFTIMATSNQDSEEYRKMEELRLKKEKELREGSKHGLDREKFERTTCELFLKWYEDKRAVAIATMQISHREKIARLRKKFFEDIDALQASGEIKLPG